jgi:hypothetical protein
MVCEAAALNGMPGAAPPTRLNEALNDPGVEISPVFVTCFSERGDDLSQWRAYSGSEGGYAIQFDAMKIRQAGFLTAPDGKITPQIFGACRIHIVNRASMFDAILKWTEPFFLGLDGAKKAPTSDAWADELCRYRLYQPAYPMTGLAQGRLVRKAMQSGASISLFQALKHAWRIVS